MRLLLTLIALITINFSTLLAQTTTPACVPDPIYKDSTFGVYPRPYDPVLFPKGGIDKSACLGKPYKFVVTAKIPATLTVSGIPVTIINAKIPTTDGIAGLPTGISYACNPPNCTFDGGKDGCIVISGTAAMTNTAKDYDLKISITINNSLGFPLVDVYPGGFNGALGNGKYTLKVEANNSATCFVSGLNENYISENMVAQVLPNPSFGNANLRIFSDLDEKMQLEISDLIGRTLYTQKVNINQGDNTINLPIENLGVGIYHYRLKNEKGHLVGKILVNQ